VRRLLHTAYCILPTAYGGLKPAAPSVLRGTLKGKRPGGDVVTKAANTASTFSRIVASEQNKVALRMQGMRILSEGSEEGEPKKITSIK